MNDFQKSLQEMMRAQSIIDELKEVAVLLGAKEQGLHPVAAMNSVRKHLNSYMGMLEEAEALGTTLPNILKGARMRKDTSAVVPGRYRYAPQQWIREAKYVNERHSKDGLTRTFTRRDKGVSTAQAQYLRKQIEPMMVDLFTALRDSDWKIDDRKAVLEEIDWSYFHDSYEDFIQTVHDWLLYLATDGDFQVEDVEPENPYAALTDEEMMELCLAGAS